MADGKSSMSNTLKELNLARTALTDADASVQQLHRLAESTHQAVKALLKQPDSYGMRMSILNLLDRLEGDAFTVMNGINSDAEQLGAHYTDEKWHDVHGAVCDAVRMGGSHVQ